MRTRWLRIIPALLILCSPVAARDNISIDARLDAAGKKVSGTIEIVLDLASADERGTDSLRFRLYPNLFCDNPAECGLVVESLFVAGRDLSAELIQEATDLSLPLPADLRHSEQLLVRMRFTTYLPDQMHRIGSSGDRFRLVAWFPIPAPRVNGEWQRVRYRPFIEPAADLCDFSATIRLSDSLQVIAPGISRVDTVDGMQIVSLELAAASDLPLFIASEFLVDSTQVGDATVKVFYQLPQQYAVDTMLAQTRLTLEYLSAKVSPYPFDELILIIDGFPSGAALELPRMVLMPRSLPAAFRVYQATVIHEVAHQWFYGIFNSNQASAPWMDEAITEYFTVKIMQASAGPDNLLSAFGVTAGYKTIVRAKGYRVLGRVPVTLSAEEFYFESSYYATVYGKGRAVIATLMAQMGEQNEDAFWRDYADRFALTSPQPDDFMALADQYLPTTAGANSGTLLNNAAPFDLQIISIENNVSTAGGTSGDGADSEDAYEVLVEYSASGPLGFPVDLRVEFIDGSIVDTVLNPTPGSHSVRFDSHAPAQAAIIDPDFKYAIDNNLLNNSLVLDRSGGAGLRLFSGVTFLVESLFSSLWSF